MTFPFSREGFVVKPLDQAQAGRPGEHRDVLPFLVALQDFPRSRRELPVNAPVLLNVPHAILCLYHLWYVKGSGTVPKAVDKREDNGSMLIREMGQARAPPARSDISARRPEHRPA